MAADETCVPYNRLFIVCSVFSAFNDSVNYMKYAQHHVTALHIITEGRPTVVHLYKEDKMGLDQYVEAI